jgi:aminoglycoside phosphotransferase family enzyme
MQLPSVAPTDAASALGAKIRFLRQPASYPEPARTVGALETHMSWVFLTDRFAYKLKKPVRFPYLDFSTAALRKHFCEEEVRLNRRLAPRVYLGTVPVTLKPGGAMALAGRGPVIDWLVKMRRLPADRMLDYAIRQGSFTREEIEQLAQRLAAFYRRAPPALLSASAYRRRCEVDALANLEELRKVGTILPHDQVERVHAAQLAFLHREAWRFEQRVSERRIIEAHGDLRPEHVALGPEPQIIDCLEFNEEFRTLDPADELAFFGMECELLGAPSVGAVVFDRYRQDDADAAALRLFDFYQCYRACLRSKLAIWHMREPQARDPEHWPRRARRYLDLAIGHAERLSTTS